MPKTRNSLADYGSIQPSPRNALIGYAADALGAINDYANMPDPSMPMGKANPVLSLLAGMTPLNALAVTANRMSYGDPLTNIGKANVPLLKPETAEAAMALAAALPSISRGALKASDKAVQAITRNPQATATGVVDYASRMAPLSWAINQPVGSAPKLIDMSPKELKKKLLQRYEELYADDPYSYYGVRVIGPDQQVNVGSILTRSSKWVDGRPLTTKLPGTAVFELRGRTADSAINKALSYNLGERGQKIAIVRGSELGKNNMPEAYSALIKRPQVIDLYERPSELDNVFHESSLSKLLE